MIKAYLGINSEDTKQKEELKTFDDFMSDMAQGVF